MEKRVKHLEFIQGVVNRLASASFQMKGWSVVLVSALLVLGVRANSAGLGIVALIPIFVFWGLDGYFLSQERLFRKLYDVVRKRKEEDIDFSMDVGKLRTGGRLGKGDWSSAVRSRTLWPFYGTLAFIAGVTTATMRYVGGGQ